MHLTRKILIMGGAAAVLIGGAAIPAVALATSSPVTFYACVTTKTGAIKIVSKTTTCAAGQHKISWNNIGPVGPRGATGPQGPQGATGPQGPPGVVTGHASFNGSLVTLSTTATAVGTLNLPAGNFLVTAKTVIASDTLTANDDARCDLTDGNGTVIDSSFTQLNPVNSSTIDQQTVALTGATTAGGTMTLACFDSLSEAIAADTAITAVPVVSVSAAPTHRPHLPSGANAARLAG